MGDRGIEREAFCKQQGKEQNPKEDNLCRIFRLISENKGISRAQVARKTSLSRATVSILTEEMLSDSLILTGGVGETSAIGRKPIRLEVNPDYGQIATVVFTQHKMLYVLYDMALNPMEEFTCEINYRRAFAEDVLNLLKQHAHMLDWDKTLCLCLSISSTILTDTYELLSTVMDIEPGYNFLLDIRARLADVPIFATNGSPMLAYAEKKFGSDTEMDNLVYINIAEGIGAGIIMDGKLFKGAYGRAGEFGHLSVDINGPMCACGNRGCIDCFLKKSAILSAFREACERNDSSLKDVFGDEEVTYAGIRRALDAGDIQALIVAYHLAEKLALAISNLICMFNPEKIVLGGGVEELGPTFFSIVRNCVMSSASKGTMWARKLTLSYTSLTGHAENLGAAKYFLDQIFTFPFRRQGQLFL